MRTGKDISSRISLAPVLLAIGLAAGSMLSASSAYALSELQKIPGQPDAPATAQQSPQQPAPPQNGSSGIPQPDPLVNKESGQSDDKTPGASDRLQTRRSHLRYQQGPRSRCARCANRSSRLPLRAISSGCAPCSAQAADQTQVTVGEPTDDPISAR